MKKDKARSPQQKDTEKKKLPVCKPKKIVIDDTRFWEIGFTKLL